ncbi:MAG TPA: hypothetical protein PK263_02750 [bacterium]|nr:hypothetical protein [bacterium]
MEDSQPNRQILDPARNAVLGSLSAAQISEKVKKIDLIMTEYRAKLDQLKRKRREILGQLAAKTDSNKIEKIRKILYEKDS